LGDLGGKYTIHFKPSSPLAPNIGGKINN